MPETAPRLRVGVGLIVKNEVASIAEWLAYHSLLGFDRIHVFDNASTDGTAEVVAHCARRLPIVLEPYPATDRDYQIRAMNMMLAAAAGEVDWLLVIDSDEFFVPGRHEAVHAFLEQPVFSGADAIGVNVAFFGSNGHVEPPSELAIASYTQRAPDHFGASVHVKSFVRPDKAKRTLNPHMFEVEGPYLNAEGGDIAWRENGQAEPPVSFDAACVNHYFVKSRREWEAKLRRGYHDFVRPDEFVYYDRNEVPDMRAARLAPAVRALLAQMA